EPVGRRSLPRRQRDPPRAVAELLRDLRGPRRRPPARGPRLMLATALEEVAPARPRGVARLGSGPPLLLLHGYPENLQIWCEVAPRLAERFADISFDGPGMACSEPWPGGKTPGHMADRLLRLLDAWQIERATIV